MNDLQHDDFGESNGNRFFEDGGRAQQIACSWTPQAVGNRPTDWAIRDLIIGGAQRDSRNWAIQQLIKNRHPKFFADTYAMPEKQRNGVCRARSFLFFHYLKLLQLERLVMPPANASVRRLLSCTPNLYLVQSSPEHRVLRACKQSHLCPFCLSRTANEVAQQIRQSNRDGSVFVLASVQKQIPSLLDGRRSVVPKYRRQFSVGLRKLAKDIGAESGVFTLQIGPQSKEVPKFRSGEVFGTQDCQHFNLRAAALFEISPDSFCFLSGLESETLEAIPSFQSLRDQGDAPEVVVEMNYGRDAIRSLVFGEAPGNENAATWSGHAGVFAYQQWHLASVSQWQEYITAIRGSRLYTVWGNWSSIRNRPTQNSLTLASSRRGPYRQRQALAKANTQRKKAADDNAEELGSRLEPHISMYSEKIGSWPGWRAIQDIAAEESIVVSQRLARRIARQFQNRDQEEGPCNQIMRMPS